MWLRESTKAGSASGVPNGKHLYHYQQRSQWVLADEFSPTSPECLAWVNAEGGLLPVGEHKWSVRCHGRWHTQAVATQLLNTAEQVTQLSKYLPSGWSRKTPEFGKIIYVNESTGQSTHEWPVLPMGWTTGCFEGWVFYVHISTRVTTFDWLTLPLGWRTEVKQEKPYSFSPATPFYVNDLTKLQGPEWPFAEGVALNNRGTAGQLPALPSGWTRGISSTHGDIYYVNARTGQSTWDWPDDADAAAVGDRRQARELTSELPPELNLLPGAVQSSTTGAQVAQAGQRSRRQLAHTRAHK